MKLAPSLLLLLAAVHQAAAGSLTAPDRSQQHVFLPPHVPENGRPEPARNGVKRFSLRSIMHVGSHKYPGLMREMEINKDSVFTQSDAALKHGVSLSTTYDVATNPASIQRLVDRRRHTVDSIMDFGRRTGQSPYLASDAWTMEEVDGPNVTDKKSVLSLAYMAANAYILTPGTGNWKEIKGAFNYTEDFGWEQDGLRGHIFADTTNSTVVVAVKGTSMAIFDGADTTGHDKDNDNLFGSCCCAQQGQPLWKKVCNCATDAFTCNSTCLDVALREKSHYYHAAQDLYHNVTERYPNADIWMTGHSLGGVVSSLLGLTYGFPVVTYEAYPEALAAGRLGLPTPPGYRTGRHQDRADTQITHIGHTGDPVFTGSCNSGLSGCTIAGYAFQSLCHTGQVATYDTVGDLGWTPGVNSHRILVVIDQVLKAYDDVPAAEVEEDCVDCQQWKFYESNSTQSTTTSALPSKTSSKTKTRTATCQTPGWFGCLDETSSKEYTTTETITTTSCLSPGWFSCKELVTTTQTTTITTSSAVQAPAVTTIPATSTISSKPAPSSSLASKTATCTSPGWFGCKDSSSTTPTSSIRPSSSASTSASLTSTTCTSKGLFWCKDHPSSTSAP